MTIIIIITGAKLQKWPDGPEKLCNVATHPVPKESVHYRANQSATEAAAKL